jgi:hypothetical protein
MCPFPIFSSFFNGKRWRKTHRSAPLRAILKIGDAMLKVNEKSGLFVI